jgi:hypothetical protein
MRPPRPPLHRARDALTPHSKMPALGLEFHGVRSRQQALEQVVQR